MNEWMTGVSKLAVFFCMGAARGWVLTWPPGIRGNTWAEAWVWYISASWACVFTLGISGCVCAMVMVMALQCWEASNHEEW